jgi:hypothetical protein
LPFRAPVFFGIAASLFALSSCALLEPKPPASQRIVRVKAMADAAFRERNPQWPKEAAGLIEAASDYFEREFQIRLVSSKIAPWSPEKGVRSTALLLEQLKESAPLKDPDGEYDLIVGFTGEAVNVYRGRARVDRIGNCEEGLGNYVLSSVSRPFRYEAYTTEPELDLLALIHEIGHVFGAEHTQETDSIMHEAFAYRTGFDRKNREIVMKNRLCRFHR